MVSEIEIDNWDGLAEISEVKGNQELKFWYLNPFIKYNSLKEVERRH